MKQPAALEILMSGRKLGTVFRDGARLRFEYDDEWREAGPGIPLSMSMRLTEKAHKGSVITPWMWGLLPDNDRTLQRIATEHEVSPRSAFALLWKIGQDCPGAVQFVEHGHAADLGGDIRWIDDEELGRRLAVLRRDESQGRTRTEGQFSLAGAQPKTALCLVDGRWGIPSGRVPTTHIFKPPSTTHAGQAENEHFCLRLAREIGIVTARSQVLRFGDEIAIVVERYDRVRSANDIRRVHQEDICQALGVHPESKYEVDRGPGITAIMRLLERSSDAGADRRRFMEMVAFNFLIGGTDAHAKNFSLLFGRNNQVRLAPLYDVASYLPYTDRWTDVRMPMRIDKYYIYSEIKPRHWRRMADAVGFPADEAVEMVREFSPKLFGAAETVADGLKRDGIDHPVIASLTTKIRDRCHGVAATFGATKP